MQVSALPKGQGTVILWRELLCVWGEHGRGEQGWLWVTCRRVVTCSQLCSTSHTGCLVTLHSYTPRVQHRTAVPPGCSGSGLPHPANLFSFKWKECHKTPGIGHKVGVFTTTGITCMPNMRKYTKILLLLQVWNCFKYLMLDLAVLI